MRNAVLIATLLLFSMEGQARGQESRPRFELGAHLATTSRDELDTTDVGFGGRFGFRASSLLGIEGELSFYPSDVPDNAPITSSRLEGLFGIQIGPRFDRFSLFGKARPGFVRFAGAPSPVACILIYPPPLNCLLAEGQTVFALDLGAGIELYPTKRSLLRVDVSNLLLRYPGPAIPRDGDAHTEGGFWGGNLRLSFGAGLRF